MLSSLSVLFCFSLFQPQVDPPSTHHPSPVSRDLCLSCCKHFCSEAFVSASFEHRQQGGCTASYGPQEVVESCKVLLQILVTFTGETGLYQLEQAVQHPHIQCIHLHLKPDVYIHGIKRPQTIFFLSLTRNPTKPSLLQVRYICKIIFVKRANNERFILETFYIHGKTLAMMSQLRKYQIG